MPEQRPEIHYSQATIAAVLFGCFMAQTGLGFGYVFSVTLKHIVSEFEWSRTAFSLASTPLLLSMALSSPLVGKATSNFGGRVVASVAIVLLNEAAARQKNNPPR